MALGVVACSFCLFQVLSVVVVVSSYIIFLLWVARLLLLSCCGFGYDGFVVVAVTWSVHPFSACFMLLLVVCLLSWRFLMASLCGYVDSFQSPHSIVPLCFWCCYSSEKLQFRLKMFKLREDRDITPTMLGSLVSSMLYERRFGYYFVEPIVCGLEPQEDGSSKPFVMATDLIGAACFPGNFAVGGTCSESLYGMCESLWKEDMVCAT